MTAIFPTQDSTNEPQPNDINLPFGSYGRKGKLVCPMKAYWVHNDYAEYAMIVFAESRGKAISYALGSDEFPTDVYEFTDLRAKRVPVLDRFYRGKVTMDWGDDEDRVAMVRFAGCTCSAEVYDSRMCKACPAKDYCDDYPEEDDDYE